MSKHIEESQYAKNMKGKQIFINDSESGRKGYYCIGCDHEMEAVKRKVEYYKSYFRHIPLDKKKGERDCTFSNETYRHSLVKNLLQLSKRIKVPPLYKFVEFGEITKKYKIKDAEFIHASLVKNEVIFYENDDGEVKWGQQLEIEEKNLLFIPDVVFFDSKSKPILLIEITATHKVSYEKLAKIRRLGINTIEIIIPKSSPEDIENNLNKSDNKVWLYNYEEQRIETSSLSERDGETLLQTDEFQNLCFEETYKCRATEINNLIRAISRNLESQQYKILSQGIESEIYRVENNTERAEQQLSEFTAKVRERTKKEFRERIEFPERDIENNIRGEKGILNELFQEKVGLEKRYNRKGEELEKRHSDLEGRYLSKRTCLEGETERVEEDIDKRRNDKRSREYYIDKINGFESEIARVESEIRAIDARRDSIRTRFEEKGREQETEYSKKEEILESSFRRKRDSIDTKSIEVEKEYEDRNRNLRKSFDKERTGAIRAVKEKDFNGKFRLGFLFEGIIQSKRIFEDRELAFRTYRKYQKANAIIRNQSYKNWD